MRGTSFFGVVKPWMDGVAAGRHYVFQQDGAPAHNSKMAQDWCAANLLEFWPKEIWPPSSPDFNPRDYNVWRVCERDINKAPHNTAASLMAKIMEVMANLRGPLWRRPASISGCASREIVIPHIPVNNL
jgi:hypothetical protein